MTTPVQATLAIPPRVEYVAVGCAVVGVVWPEGPALSTGVVVVVASGVLVAPGCGDRDEDAPGDDGALGVSGAGAGAGGGTEAGTVKVGPFGCWAMLVDVVPTADEPDSTSFTTSAWATTAAGRSVTSAATMEVAAHTTAVDPTEAASHRLVWNRRGCGTDRECHESPAPSAKETLNFAAAHAPGLVPSTNTRARNRDLRQRQRQRQR